MFFSVQNLMKFCINEDLLRLGLACLKFLWSGVSGLGLAVYG